MKFLFICILSLGIFSCNIPKNNAPKADTEYQTKSSSSSNKNKDSLYIELKQCHFPQLCAIIIPIPPATTKTPIVKKNQKNH